jgi:hypothetical protein
LPGVDQLFFLARMEIPELSEAKSAQLSGRFSETREPPAQLYSMFSHSILGSALMILLSLLLFN